MVSIETLPFLPWPNTRMKTEMGMAGFVGKLGQLLSEAQHAAEGLVQWQELRR